MILSVLLCVLGLSGLSAIGWFLWWPLVLLPFSAAALLAGLTTDWEAARGKSAGSSPQR
jgi:hypothetical protein